jgi:hypothetical protein
MAGITIPKKKIEDNELRNLFNQANYWGQVQSGELSATVEKSKHPAPPAANQPFCTSSQIVYYWDGSGQRVAVVHQYLKADGTIGGSGRPDPKYLLHEGVLYVQLGKKV